MLIQRWQAQQLPNKAQIMMLLQSEGLDTFEERFLPNVKINEHRHPFGEVRIVVSGELMFNIGGSQFLLRAGDRVEIPANTRHSHTSQGDEPCVCICAQRIL